MLYTLLKFLGWGALLALIGGCIGWALRSLKSRGEVARVRSEAAEPGVDDESIRDRLASLDQVVAERDRLRIQLADVRHADSPGIVGAEVPRGPEPAAVEAAGDGAAEGDAKDPDDETSSTSTDDTETHDTVTLEAADLDTVDLGTIDPDTVDPYTTDLDTAELDTADLDVEAAAARLGRPVRLDDLTVVEGIGPKISELCHGIGISTWRQLADTDIAELQSMLDDAGSRYAVHRPGTWPQQARLLADGRWDDFAAFHEGSDSEG